jgi:hypothetical protein
VVGCIVIIIQNNHNVLNTNHNLGQPYQCTWPLLPVVVAGSAQTYWDSVSYPAVVSGLGVPSSRNTMSSEKMITIYCESRETSQPPTFSLQTLQDGWRKMFVNKDATLAPSSLCPLHSQMQLFLYSGSIRSASESYTTS